MRLDYTLEKQGKLFTVNLFKIDDEYPIHSIESDTLHSVLLKSFEHFKSYNAVGIWCDKRVELIEEEGDSQSKTLKNYKEPVYYNQF